MTRQKSRRLTDLELEIMHVVWELERGTVRQVHEVLATRRQIAYTTVMSTMDNLHRKQWLERDRARVLELASPNGMAAELAVRRPGPERLTVTVPRTHDATYRGKILGVTPHHVLQKVGRKRVVAHCIKDFARAPSAADDVSVRYYFGRVKSVKSRDRGVERER